MNDSGLQESIYRQRQKTTEDPPEAQLTVASQAEWANRAGLELNRNKTGLADRSKSIFGGLDPKTHDQLAAGAGDELNRIHSLRSSAALAVNVFQPWKNQPRIIGRLFGANGVRRIDFEQRQPIWPPAENPRITPPHLDVLLTGPTVGIESKFLELYDPAKNSFADRYFLDEAGVLLWGGLVECRRLAERIVSGEEAFAWLPVGQLLKHALGMSRTQTAKFRLVLVWYRVEGATADAIEAEIGRFARCVAGELDFTAITYQELVSLMRTLSWVTEPLPGYFEYLEDRYRLGVEEHRALPLITLGKARDTKRKTGLATTTANLDGAELVTAYHQTVARAPQRSLVDKRYLVPTHDGGGGHDLRSQEKVAAKAIFNSGEPMVVGGEPVEILDYEVPLAARASDRGVGDIDLLGRGTSSGRPWIIELKVGANNEPPYSALLQALRYSAMAEANRRQINVEVRSRTGLDLEWPAVLAVAADQAYWERWQRESTPAGDWVSSLRQLAAGIESALGIKTVFLELGDLSWDVIDGRAQLMSPLVVRRVQPLS